MHAATLLQPLKISTAGQSIILRLGHHVAHMQWPQLLGCGTRSPLYLIGDTASRCGLSRVGYFHPAQRPVERTPS